MIGGYVRVKSKVSKFSGFKGLATRAETTGRRVGPFSAGAVRSARQVGSSATPVTRHWHLHRLCRELMGSNDGPTWWAVGSVPAIHGPSWRSIRSAFISLEPTDGPSDRKGIRRGGGVAPRRKVLHPVCVIQMSRGSEAVGARRTTTTVLPSVGLGVGVGRLPTVQHPSARRQGHMGQIGGLSVMKQAGLDLEILGKPAVTPAVTKTAVPTGVGKEQERDARRLRKHYAKVRLSDVN